METTIVVLLILIMIGIVGIIILGLLIGSVVVQCYELIKRLLEENSKKPPSQPERPWYTYHI